MNDTIVFTRGVPPPEAFPVAQLAECVAAAIQSDPAVVLQYGQQQGYAPLRALLAAEYGVPENEVMVANGSLQLQDLLAAHLVRPGMTVLTEQPGYDRAIMTFRRRGARVVGVPLEADGVDVARLEAEVRRQTPAFLYLVPDFQNPAGVTTSAEKRRAILALAERYGFWVVEDIPYRRLRYRGEPVPMLREINPQRVVTMTSFSKLLSPGMRVGYMVAPAQLVAAITKEGEHTYLSPVLPTQAAVAEFIRRGWLQPNIERLKQLYRPRWDAMLGAVRRHLEGVTASEPDGGFFVSVTLPAEANTRGLVERAKAIGLVLTEGQAFFADPDEGPPPDGERFVRLPFCAVTPQQIDEGVRRLASLL
ncbi:MAG: PLP-dependent aminotransferase family protein [Chloroflexi bacterium]|nr:PLP-dependent aminotransferase family protein [Chloroflexota bacterium]